MLVHVVPYDALKAHMPRGLKRRISFEANNIHEVITRLNLIPGTEAMLHLYRYEWRIGPTWKNSQRHTTAEGLVANKLSGLMNEDGSVTIHLRPDISAGDPGTIITSLVISAITTGASMLISYLNPPNQPRNDTSKSQLYNNSGNTTTEGGALPYLMGRYCYIEPLVIEMSVSTLAGAGQAASGGFRWDGNGSLIFDALKYQMAYDNSVPGDAAGGSKSPRRIDNNAESNAIQRVLFAVGAGKTGGIVGRNQHEKEANMWINDSQYRDPNTGQYAIPSGSMSWEENVGVEGQPAIGLSPGIANSQGRSRRLKALTNTGSPDRHEETMTSELVDRAVIRVRTSALVQRDKKGNESNTQVDIRIRCKRVTDSQWLDRGIFRIGPAKSTSAFDREYNVSAPPKKENGETWEIEFLRLTADSEDDGLQNETTLVGFDEFQDREFAYDGTESPGAWPTATVGAVFSLSEMDTSQSPKFGLLTHGMEAWIPRCYDPETRVYRTTGPGTLNGQWDGSLVKGITDNGAWLWLTMMVTPRLGLGLPLSYFDRYQVYAAAQYNDQIVNGRPRFVFNETIREFGKKWDVASEVARSFRCQQFWAGDRVILVQDRPTGFKRHTVSNAVVKGGNFNVSTTPMDKRFNVVEVIWRNPKDQWRENITVWRDEAHIAMMAANNLGTNGEFVTRVRQMGCQNEQQAYDFGRMVSYDACYQTKTRTWETNLIGTLYLPGDIIEVDNQNVTGKPPVERIRRVIDADTLELDHPVTLKAGSEYTIRGVLQGVRAVRAVAPVATDFTGTQIIVPGHGLVARTPVSLVEAGGIQPREMRLVGIDQGSTLGMYSVTAQQHDEAKYAYIEQNVPVPVTPYTDQVTTITAPINTSVEEKTRWDDNQNGAFRDLRFSWQDGDNPASRPAGQQFREQRSGYEAEYRVDNGAWTRLGAPTVESFADLLNVLPGKYDFRVRALNTVRSSAWAFGSKIVTVEGTSKPPAPSVEAYY